MRSRYLLVAPLAAAIALSSSLSPSSAPAAAPIHASGQDTTTLDDQVELAVTVYNSDIALVRDVRRLTLPSGEFDLKFMDIAATVNPATVHFRSLTEPSRVSVLEQNYEYDLLEPEKLLRKYVGREVTLVRSVQQDGTTRQEEVKAELLSYNNAPVWRIGKEIVTGLHADHIRFPELPDNLFSRPTLIWTLQNGGAQAHRVEASYLAGKLAWTADYVLTVARDDKIGDLDGWVTLQNGSGTAFRNAKLQLVAGDLNRVRQAIEDKRFDEARSRMEMAAARAPMAQEAFSEYHLYTLGRKTTINNAETKQVSMLSGTGVPVQKRFIVDGQAAYYHNQQHPGAPIKDVVQVYYQFKNEREGRAGDADACGHRAGVSGRLEGRRAVCRRGPHQSHTEGRNAEAEDRECVRRRLRTEPDRFPEDCQQRLRVRVPDHAAQSQGNADHGGGQRADRRQLAYGPVVAHRDEDRGLGRAVQRPGRGGWDGDGEVPGAGYLLTLPASASRDSRLAAAGQIRGTLRQVATASREPANRESKRLLTDCRK